MSLFLSNLNLNKNELQNAKVHNLASAPASPGLGQLYYDTGSNTVFYYNGTTWVSTSGGTPADATTTTKGVVQLAGDLTGTAASPAVANLAITAAKIANATITDTQVAAANKDGVAGTASLRTIGTGAQQAMAGNTTLSSIAAPTADVSLNTHKLTNVTDPTGAQDAATKNYVDSTAQGLSWKQPVKVATAGTNIASLASASVTIDGVTCVQGDRVLVKDQTTPSQNGIYVVGTVTTGNAPFTLATDFNTWNDVISAAVWVEQGTVNADTGWVCTNDPGGTLGTTGITFVKFTSSSEIIAGNGLTQTGNTFSVAGTTNRISVSGAGVDISASYVGQTSITTLGTITTGTWNGTTIAVLNGGTGATTAAGARTNLGATTKFSASIGDGATTSFSVAHNLGTRDVTVQVWETAGSFNKVFPDISAPTDTNHVTVAFSVAPTTNQYRVVVQG